MLTIAHNKSTNCQIRRGFSLLEVLVALLLVALFVALSIPTIRSLTRVQLKTSANQLLGLIRDVYSRAALSGKVHRLIFDMDVNQYWVEVSNEEIHLPSEKIELKEQDGDQLGLYGNDNANEKKLRNPLAFVPVKDELGSKQKLPSGIRFFGVWVDHLKERARSGKVALHFFPEGYTQQAQISLTDDEKGEHVLTLVTEPLTGETIIENREPPIEE